jgi:hypothetical protein
VLVCLRSVYARRRAPAKGTRRPPGKPSLGLSMPAPATGTRRPPGKPSLGLSMRAPATGTRRPPGKNWSWCVYARTCHRNTKAAGSMMLRWLTADHSARPWTLSRVSRRSTPVPTDPGSGTGLCLHGRTATTGGCAFGANLNTFLIFLIFLCFLFFKKKPVIPNKLLETGWEGKNCTWKNARTHAHAQLARKNDGGGCWRRNEQERQADKTHTCELQIE